MSSTAVVTAADTAAVTTPASSTPIYERVEVRAFAQRLDAEAQLATSQERIAGALEVLSRFNYADPNGSIADLRDALTGTTMKRPQP